MRWIGGVAGVLLLAVGLWDAFETIILPRRVSGRIRLTKMFYRYTWAPWRATARVLTGRRRDAFLSFYGPLSLIALLALWAAGSVCSFGLLQWAAGSAMTVAGGGGSGFWSDVYMSGTTFFTLGLGDVVPRSAFAKTITVVEAGTGFAFLAAVIGYFPVIYTGVLAAGGRDLAARRARRLAAQRGRAPVAASGGSARCGAGRAAQGVGALGCRRAREPFVVSSARLFPVAALQRVVGGGPHDHLGRERARDRGPGGVVRAAGRADVRHGAPRGGRPGAGVQHAAPATGRAVDDGAAGSGARPARGRRPGVQGQARLRGAAHRVAPHVRALRPGPLRLPRAPAAALGARA